ncbi:MAG TPA: G/U mismatch-specific DNA glycosylase [Gemmatimonadales bacterium]|jgi:TDG/mug DNA glycosylase family protein
MPRSAATPPPRPTRAELEAANDKTIRDIIAPGLDVLFCGINPGLYSGATGHHFARPGNRFWGALHAGGFTARTLHAWEERELLDVGCGITNLVARTTATAAELDREEYLAGRKQLERKVRRYTPRWVAFVGIGAYRTAFERAKATIGEQEEVIGESRIWVLPNPSGLNANHQAADLARMFGGLRRAVEG